MKTRDYFIEVERMKKSLLLKDLFGNDVCTSQEFRFYKEMNYKAKAILSLAKHNYGGAYVEEQTYKDLVASFALNDAVINKMSNGMVNSDYPHLDSIASKYK
jgi:hypothetical protein